MLIVFGLIYLGITAWNNQKERDGEDKFLDCKVSKLIDGSEVALNNTEIKDKVFTSGSFAQLLLRARGGEIREARHNETQYYFDC